MSNTSNYIIGYDEEMSKNVQRDLLWDYCRLHFPELFLRQGKPYVSQGLSLRDETGGIIEKQTVPFRGPLKEGFSFLSLADETLQELSYFERVSKVFSDASKQYHAVNRTSFDKLKNASHIPDAHLHVGEFYTQMDSLSDQLPFPIVNVDSEYMAGKLRAQECAEYILCFALEQKRFSHLMSHVIFGLNFVGKLRQISDRQYTPENFCFEVFKYLKTSDLLAQGLGKIEICDRCFVYKRKAKRGPQSPDTMYCSVFQIELQGSEL